MHFGPETTAEDVATALKDQIAGKNVLITGVSPDSLGAEAVRVVAPYAGTIVIASRSREKCSTVIDSITRNSPSVNFHFVVLDLTSKDSIRSATAEILALGIPIHVVINNAAVPQTPDIVRTSDGFEAQFGANHLGHFYFTSLILSAILRSTSSLADPARIVNVSSGRARMVEGIRWDDPNFTKRPEEYQRTMPMELASTLTSLLQLASSRDWARKFAFSLHPGAVLNTEKGRGIPKDVLIRSGVFNDDGTPKFFFKTTEQGVATHVIAAFDPSLINFNGGYLEDGAVLNDKAPSAAQTEKTANRLWQLSKSLLNVTFRV